jgi:hypothetical protein
MKTNVTEMTAFNNFNIVFNGYWVAAHSVRFKPSAIQNARHYLPSFESSNNKAFNTACEFILF